MKWGAKRQEEDKETEAARAPGRVGRLGGFVFEAHLVFLKQVASICVAFRVGGERGDVQQNRLRLVRVAKIAD